ncbi:hypothetical protein CO613_10860 [Lysobacteraceae bacterium NML07-0707]|nr:hypothetical protein CO613_10860 [Xanthomonadaceae bacterium NML07-0707]
MSAAQKVLRRLFKRAEAARLRASDKPASLVMTGKRDGAEYQTLRTLPELEAFHAHITLAERAGAICVQRARHRGDGQDLERITVADLDALADFVGLQPLQAQIAQAQALLTPWRERFPVLEDVLATWRAGGRVRTHTAQAAGAIADAARVVAHCQQDPTRERSLRAESVRLFADSKYLETLTPWLDLIGSGQLQAHGALEKTHVWAALGLRKEPLPLLLAGTATLHLQYGELPLLRPWLGVPPESLHALQTPARCLLSIENLSSFHEAARLHDANTLLLYTGGMPSPAWRRAYDGILRCLPADARIYHWGDIDRGGFHIASVLAHSAQQAGRRLLPWRMSPGSLPTAIGSSAHRAAPDTLKAMCYWAERAGWPEIAQALRQQPLTLEQEHLDAELPGCARHDAARGASGDSGVVTRPAPAGVGE